MRPVPLFDLSLLDGDRILYGRPTIEEINPQRHEMVQLDAIVHLDHEQHMIVGYKDVREDEFWVGGHLPHFPILPGVLLCEAAAQLTGFYSMKCGMVDGSVIVFSGMNNVRFRGQVRPGDRVWFVGKATRINRRKTDFAVQGFVGGKMVFQAEVFGMPFTPGVAAAR
jgi:3-hydroxyacyl-[acyl-carrier-protein] dehydratase